MKPIATGLTLSITVVLFYALCTSVWLVLPEPFMDFMSTLFHGLDFRRLQTSRVLTWWAALYPAILFAIWFFAAGVFFAWLHNMLTGQNRQGGRR
jgi:hypothetical protein